MENRLNLIFVLILFFVLTVSLSAISANESLGDGDNLSLSNNENTTVLTDGNVGTFTDFQNLVDNAANGSSINVDKDYTYSEDSDNGYILIDKDLTINGNGHTIDGNNFNRSFFIRGSNVKINNLRFVNGCTQYGNGGSVDGFGGAIYVENCSNLELNGCYFADNSASNEGGAVFISNSSSTINNCIFTDNVASGGGAIGVYYSNFAVNNSDFTNNLANNSYGGAVNIYHSEGIFNNCSFLNNTSLRGGAIVITDKNSTINNCYFESNTGNSGGAILLYSVECTINNSSFYNNTSNGTNEDDCGGAIAILMKDLYVNGCSFINNTANSKGGAIGHIEDGFTYTYIFNSTFINNTAKTGGALHVFFANVNNSVIIDNPDSMGKDIYGIIELDFAYNWWGSNDNPENRISSYDMFTTVNNRNWVLMIFKPSNSDGSIGDRTLITSRDEKLISGLLEYTDGNNTYSFDGVLPIRNVSFNADTGIFDPTVGELVDKRFYTVYSNGTTNNTLYAVIDYQVLELSIYLVGMDIVKIANNKTVNPGQLVSFTIVVRNTGQLTLHDIRVNETDVDGLDYNGFSGVDWVKSANTFTYLNDLSPGESASFNITFSAVRSGNFTNIVFASSNETNVINATNTTTVLNPNDNQTNHTNNTDDDNNTNNKTNKTYSQVKKMSDSKVKKYQTSGELVNYNTGNPLSILVLSLMSLSVIYLKPKD
ncbi:MAG: hypothetical protein ACI37V_08250 [Methanobrevibacter sp.]